MTNKIETYLIRQQRVPSEAFRVVGHANYMPAIGQVVVPVEVEDWKAEIDGAIRFLSAEKAAVSCRTVCGFEVEKMR